MDPVLIASKWRITATVANCFAFGLRLLRHVPLLAVRMPVQKQDRKDFFYTPFH